MAKPTKQQIGDGTDNYGNAARKMAQAARQAGKTAQAATTATANSAASTVAGRVKVGKAVAGVAKGAAIGGPWGAVISAAWSLKNTLLKVFTSVCIFLLILIITIVSLPFIIFENLFGWIGDFNGEENALYASYQDLSNEVANFIEEAYDATIGRIVDLIEKGGHHLGLSMEHLIDNTMGRANYDVCYILSAYSVSVGQSGASKEGLMEDMYGVIDKIFPFTYEEHEKTFTIFDGIKDVLKVVTYLVCTIFPFDMTVLLEAFNLDLDAKYENTSITTGEYIDYMTNSLKMTLGEEID